MTPLADLLGGNRRRRPLPPGAKAPHYNPYVADAAFNHPVPGISQPLRSIRRKVYGLPKSK